MEWRKVNQNRAEHIKRTSKIYQEIHLLVVGPGPRMTIQRVASVSSHTCILFPETASIYCFALGIGRALNCFCISASSCSSLLLGSERLLVELNLGATGTVNLRLEEVSLVTLVPDPGKGFALNDLPRNCSSSNSAEDFGLGLSCNLLNFGSTGFVNCRGDLTFSGLIGTLDVFGTGFAL